MADSTQDFTRKILVDVEIKAEQVKKDIPALTDTLTKFKAELEALTVTQKELTKTGDTNSKTYRENSKAIVETTQSMRQLKADIREANKYIDNAAKAINAETGSIQQQRAVVSLLTTDVIKVGNAQGKMSDEFLREAKVLNEATERLKEHEKQIGQTYRNVGNYTDSINKANIALKEGAGGIKLYSSIQEGLNKGFGFLPQATAGAGASLTKLTGVFGALSSTVQNFTVGFKTQTQLIQEAKAAEDNLARAKEIVTAAMLAEEAAQEGLTAGTVSSIAVQAAAIDKEQAQVAALTAQAIATEAATVATESCSNALRIFKIALASTGIGLLIVALAAVAEYFTNTNEGALKFDVLSSRLGATLDIVRGKLASLGKEIVDYIDGVNSAGEAQNKTWGQSAISNIVKFGEKLSNVFGLLTLNPISLYNGLSNNTTIKAAADAAQALTEQRQKLTIAEREYNNTTRIEQQNELNVQRARIRNLHYTTEERQAAAERAKVLSKQMYDTDIHFAVESQKIIEGQQALKLKAGVKIDKVAIAEAKGRILTRQGQYQQEQEMLDAREARVDKMAASAADKEKKEAEKKKAQQLEFEQLEKESEMRMLQNIYEEYADRAIAADTNYRGQIAKLKEYLVQEKITKQQYNTVAAQYEKEHQSTIAKIIKDFQDKDYKAFEQADAQLRRMQIANIQETTVKLIASLQDRGDSQIRELNFQDNDIQEKIDSLNIELLNKNKQFSADELAEIKARIDAENLLLEINKQKKAQIAKETAEAVTKARAKAESDQQLTKDGRSIKDAKKTSNVFNDSALKANEIKAVHDKYQYEIDENKRALAAVEADNTLSMSQKLEAEKALRGKIKEAESQEQDEIAAIQKAHLVAKVDFYAAAEQQVQGALMDLFSQSIQQQESAALASAEARKNGELNNASLTNTQKQLINAKYDKEERKIKLKAFKDNQKLQIANALINGAVAVIKNIAEMGFIPSIPANILTVALTAIEVGKIASQKPGFATGGQYVSDGRGAALPGYSTRDNINATLRDGEGVVVSEAMRVPWARNTISSINEQFGGRSFSVPGNYGLSMPAFASGGQFTDGGNANRYYSQPIINSGELANSIAYQLINNMPAIMVDVKDINTQQGILAQTLDRVNL